MPPTGKGQISTENIKKPKFNAIPKHKFGQPSKIDFQCKKGFKSDQLPIYLSNDPIRMKNMLNFILHNAHEVTPYFWLCFEMT